MRAYAATIHESLFGYKECGWIGAGVRLLWELPDNGLLDSFESG